METSSEEISSEEEMSAFDIQDLIESDDNLEDQLVNEDEDEDEDEDDEDEDTTRTTRTTLEIPQMLESEQFEEPEEPEAQVFLEGYQGGQRTAGEMQETLEIQTYLKSLRETMERSNLNADIYIPSIKTIKRFWKLNPLTVAQAIIIIQQLGNFNPKKNKDSLIALLEKTSKKSQELDSTNILRYYKLLSGKIKN